MPSAPGTKVRGSSGMMGLPWSSLVVSIRARGQIAPKRKTCTSMPERTLPFCPCLATLGAEKRAALILGARRPCLGSLMFLVYDGEGSRLPRVPGRPDTSVDRHRVR